MKSKCFASREREVGQSMVELALFLLLILVLLAGVMDFGRLMFEYQAMRDATQEGAEYASLYPNYCAEIFNRINANLPENGTYSIAVSVDSLGCEQAWNEDKNHTGAQYHGCESRDVTITINHNFEISTPLLGSITGASIPLRAEVKDRIIRPSCPK